VDVTDPVAVVDAPGRRTLQREIVLVFALSLGASAVYSVVSLIATLTEKGGLASATATLNESQAPGRPWLDLTYQLLGLGFALVPVFLALHFLARDFARPTRLIGFDLTRPVWDLGAGVGLAALIGIPGLGLYVAAKSLGLNATIMASALPKIWWGVPVLVLAAIRNAVSEEVLVVGDLMTRLEQLRFRPAAQILTSAVLRGSYHLYQGFGGFVGNFVMGVVFGFVYRRYRRVMPLVVAHSILDIVSFVGYALLAPHLSWLR
jgi:membrane protease YdiL (CAAX protease family)